MQQQLRVTRKERYIETRNQRQGKVTLTYADSDGSTYAHGAACVHNGIASKTHCCQCSIFGDCTTQTCCCGSVGVLRRQKDGINAEQGCNNLVSLQK